MAGLLAALQFWHWWVLAAVLAGIEALAPGMFFIWFGLAAGLVGLAALLVPGLDWRWQGLLFAVFAALTVTIGRRYLQPHPSQTEDPGLNRRAERYLGRLFTLETPIVNGRGSIKVDDSVWRAAGPDMAAGRRVKVVGVDGAILKVEAAD
jgi:membrane protein implicated in regulation of membrane protease activity